MNISVAFTKVILFNQISCDITEDNYSHYKGKLILYLKQIVMASLNEGVQLNTNYSWLI